MIAAANPSTMYGKKQVERGDCEYQEAPEDQRVGPACRQPLPHLALPDDFGEEDPDAAADLIGSRFGTPSAHETDLPSEQTREDEQRADQIDRNHQAGDVVT
jgi:hypothetical protein